MSLKMDQPLVSIIIPAYNSEKYLAETISSALSQTWPNKEVILVDDGSTDGSLAVAKKFESVKVFHQNNKGASAARNKGLKESKGEFIQFLDGDDLLSPDKIATQVDILQQNPGKIAACSTIHFENGSLPGQGTPTPGEDNFLFNDDDPAHFLVNFLGGFKDVQAVIGVHTWLTPKSIIDKAGPWNEELTVDDDGEFFSRVILNSKGIIKTAGAGYYRKYKNQDESLSSQNNKKSLESIFKAILLKKDHLSAFNNSEAAERAINKHLTVLAVSVYPFHKELYKEIEKELEKYSGHHFMPSLGGKFINNFAKMFGWKTAIKLKVLLNK
jgi:glycosyltransferase involved in cell wall biosynthesis